MVEGGVLNEILVELEGVGGGGGVVTEVLLFSSFSYIFFL